MSYRFQVTVTRKDQEPITLTKYRFFSTKKKAEIYKRAMEKAGFKVSIMDIRSDSLS